MSIEQDDVMFVDAAGNDNAPTAVAVEQAEVAQPAAVVDAELLQIQMTDAAARRVQELITEEENPELKLRVYVTGGGCSGFQYGFTFAESANEGDIEVSKNGVVMLIDPMSLQYLVGGEVDFVSGLEGSRFLVTNPNATTTCGCGSSFSI